MPDVTLEVEWGAQLADLKEGQYQNLLGLAAVLDLLVDKGILSRSEIAAKAVELDRLAGVQATADLGADTLEDSLLTQTARGEG